MSKKHNNHQVSHSSSPSIAHAAEYKIIKHDLIKVIILNAIYLAGVLTLYFTNQKSQYLEKWFSGMF